MELPSRDGAASCDVIGVLSPTPQTLAAHQLPDVIFYKRSVELLPGDTGAIDAAVVRAVLVDNTRDQDHSFIVRAEQTPNPESRITLGSATDALGMPRVDLNWQFNQTDLVGLREAIELLGAELGATGLGRLHVPTEDGAFAWPPGPGGHHMGTTRMSDDPASGVVDANCRAHDVHNLYVAGSSVFPTGGAANPTLTVVALAERLADHLAAL